MTANTKLDEATKQEELRNAQQAAQEFDDAIDNFEHILRTSVARIYSFWHVPRDADELEFLGDDFWACYDKCETKQTELAEKDLMTADLKKELSLLDDEISQHTQRCDSAVDTVLPDGSHTRAGRVSSEMFGHWGPKLLDLSRRRTEILQAASKIRRTLCEEEDRLNKFVVRALAKVDRLPFEVDEEENEQSQASEDQQEDEVDKAAQRDRLNQAVDQVRRCEANLKAARSDTLSVPDSWDSDKRGQARVHKMVRRNNELGRAEEEYHAALQEVECEGPLGEASDLSEPEAHIIAAALSIAGSSLGDPDLERVEQWKSMIPEGATAAFAEKSAEDDDMDWNKLTFICFGEVVGEHCEAAEGERKVRIEARKQDYEALKKSSMFEAAEDDFHPRNRGVNTSCQEVSGRSATQTAGPGKRLDGNKVDKSVTVGSTLGHRPSASTSGKASVDHVGQGPQALTVDNLVHGHAGDIVARVRRRRVATNTSDYHQRKSLSAPPMTRD